MKERVSTPAAERGVYWAMATKAGKPMVFAVDSKGDEVRRLVLQDDSWARAEAAIEHLWNYLDVVDPKPSLHIVRPTALPNPTLRVRPEVYDPYEDPRPLPGVWRHRH